MGLKNFFQAAKQEAIEQIVAERLAETETKVRSQVLQELRGMTPDEIADLLARETQGADGNSTGQS